MGKATDMFIAAMREKVHLPAYDRRAILGDIRALADYLVKSGLTEDEAVARIGGDILGDFYKTPDRNEWYRLDCAARLYPLYATRYKMGVFRVSAYLNENVVPEALQVALLSTLKRFPLYATTVRRGFFWHYMDATRRHFPIYEEKDMPVQPLRLSRKNAVSFRLQYFEKRISLEIFHILADGLGAMTFLKSLVREYQRILGVDIPLTQTVLDVSQAPRAAEWEDAYLLNDQSEIKAPIVDRPALQMNQRRARHLPASVIQFVMPADALVRLARAHNSTVTAVMLAFMFLSARKCVGKGKRGRIAFEVPVNLRPFYQTETLRNFALFTLLSADTEEITDFEGILPLVGTRLKEGTDKRRLDALLHSTAAAVVNPLLRYTPLVLKRGVFRILYKYAGEAGRSSTLSNLGVVKDDFCGTVDKFEIVLGASGVSRTSCGMVACQNKAVFSMTNATRDDAFCDEMLRLLRERGIPVSVSEVRQ
ncbi:MAG: hypothetical protein Q4D04_09105 [Clostridia bacterium]|nr:hypothetical protein [Clostridia bacterium]